ncbi:MAG: prepilin-type N-terminal cleavage/methylation domain-containing protein, partial [Verrucomicrobia bacterium]|nr:prepilin-type N-terminal cleavage/methylation domain-containing protein [Verrucomicrobiota bacterium]
MNPMPRHFSPALCRKRAFTLVETLITLAIFGVTAIGMIELYLFGLRLNSMVNVKLQATEGARHAMSILATDIRDAGIVYVGNGDASSFTNSAFDAPQEGNALEIYPSKTNLNDYIIYYLDSSDGQLKRL